MLKKINRLIVPYYFFVLLGNVILFIVYHIDDTEFVYTSPLFLAFTENSHKTYQFGAVWFLISLFVVYIIFLVIKKISKGIVYKEVIYTLLICTIGYILGKNTIRIPFYIDSSMTGYFFFYLGYMLNKKTKLLSRKESKSKLIGMSVFCLILVYLFSEGGKGFYPNEYSCSWINLFLIGGIGVYGLLLLSKLIGKVPILTNIGRYSIIYLGTHQYFQFIIERFAITFIDINTYVFQISELFVVILLSYISSIIMLKYVPYLVAQKDIVHIIR